MEGPATAETKKATKDFIPGGFCLEENSSRSERSPGNPQPFIMIFVVWEKIVMIFFEQNDSVICHKHDSPPISYTSSNLKIWYSKTATFVNSFFCFCSNFLSLFFSETFLPEDITQRPKSKTQNSSRKNERGQIVVEENAHTTSFFRLFYPLTP